MKISLSYFVRDFNLDFKNLNPSHPAARIGRIALPFLCLHAPLARPLSMGMGALRLVSDIKGKDAYAIALSATALVGSILHHRTAIFLSTAGEIVEILRVVKRGEGKEEHFLQIAQSLTYLATLCISGPEMLLVSLIAQAVLELYRTRSEWKAGLKPEALAHLAMVVIRGYQGYEIGSFLYAKHQVLSNPRYRHLNKILSELDDDFLKGHPLENLEEFIEKHRVMIDDKDLGAHIGHMGQDAVKGMNLVLRKKEDGVEVIFKLTHVFREKLEPFYVSLMQLEPSEVKEFLFYAGLDIGNVKFGKVLSSYKYTKEEFQPFGHDYRIEVEDLGDIRVGATLSVMSLYDRVITHLKPGKNVRDLHHLLAVAGVGKALRPSTSDDIERMKIGHLLHIYHPQEALALERSENFFKMSLQDLRASITKQHADMATRLEEQNPIPIEVLPGKIRYIIPGLAKEVYARGGRGLFVGVGSHEEEEESFKRIAAMLKGGALSTQLRQESAIPVNGLGPAFDEYVASSDSIFSRLITKSAFGTPIQSIQFAGEAQLVFSLDVLETGTYQYDEDHAGSRLTPDHIPQDSLLDWMALGDLANLYSKRDDILTFTEKMQNDFSDDNEVMIKDRVPPSKITACIVQSEKSRDRLIEVLEKHDLIHAGKILGKPVEEFIHVETWLSKELFQSAAPSKPVPLPVQSLAPSEAPLLQG